MLPLYTYLFKCEFLNRSFDKVSLDCMNKFLDISVKELVVEKGDDYYVLVCDSGSIVFYVDSNNCIRLCLPDFDYDSLVYDYIWISDNCFYICFAEKALSLFRKMPLPVAFILKCSIRGSQIDVCQVYSEVIAS